MKSKRWFSARARFRLLGNSGEILKEPPKLQCNRVRVRMKVDLFARRFQNRPSFPSRFGNCRRRMRRPRPNKPLDPKPSLNRFENPVGIIERPAATATKCGTATTLGHRNLLRRQPRNVRRHSRTAALQFANHCNPFPPPSRTVVAPLRPGRNNHRLPTPNRSGQFRQHRRKISQEPLPQPRRGLFNPIRRHPLNRTDRFRHRSNLNAIRSHRLPHQTDRLNHRPSGARHSWIVGLPPMPPFGLLHHRQRFPRKRHAPRAR